jgi:alginate O-acetyltransferase complex protein AlgI
MLFSSTLFLFYFLPLFFLCYFLAPNIKIKNSVLLIFSFIFFAWGGISFTLILIASICFNYVFGRLIERNYSKTILAAAIGGNLLPRPNYVIYLISESQLKNVMKFQKREANP